MRRVGEATDEDGRQVIYTAHLTSLDAWHDFASDPTWQAIDEGFALFLASDASVVSPDVLVAFGEWSIGQGMFWLSTWGPDCERVHDIVDEVDVGEGAGTERPVVMTTWHANDPLDEALFLFWWAFPDEGKPGGPYRVVVVADNEEWYAAVQRIAEHHLADMSDDA
jgi:hypothetical protein